MLSLPSDKRLRQVSDIGRERGPLSPPTIAQWMPVKSAPTTEPSKGSNDTNLTTARVRSRTRVSEDASESVRVGAALAVAGHGKIHIGSSSWLNVRDVDQSQSWFQAPRRLVHWSLFSFRFPQCGSLRSDAYLPAEIVT